MNKKLNTSAIQNELSGQSVFFKEKPISTSDRKLPKESIESEVRSVREVRDVRDVRTFVKRERKRHPFDIYRDQLEKLQQMKSEYMMKTGDMKSMSEMVREALDLFIENYNNRTERTGRPDPTQRTERTEKRPT
jgi:hypothetical protein